VPSALLFYYSSNQESAMTFALTEISGKGWSGTLGHAVVASIVVLGISIPLARGADLIEDELPAQAGRVLKYLKEQGYRNVGVLKFRVKKGNEPEKFNAGPLNVAMATRLENALLIKNDKTQPIGIIHDAPRVAWSHKERASYMTPDGCEKLFKYKYPLAWGDAKVEADAFVTGLVQISPNKRTTTVRIEAMDRKSKKLRLITSFPVRTDRMILTDLCQSFVLNSRRMRTMGPKEQDDEAVGNSADRDQQQGKNQAGDRDRDVELEVVYDGGVIPIQKSEGFEVVQEPAEGQKVVFRLKNNSDERRAVVLAVNGENTLYKEPLPDNTAAGGCTKWILEPRKSYQLVGFYLEGDKSVEPFRVLSEQESDAEEEQNPHPYLGAILLTVFREGEGGSSLIRTQGLRKSLAIQRKRPRTAQEAAELARGSAGIRPKGMGYIKSDPNTQDANIESAPFKDPQQTESRVIWYKVRKKGGPNSGNP
jgi:hypothetical protein